MTNRVLFDDADVGPYHPPGSSPIQRRGERGVVAGVVVVDLEAIEQNLEGLTMNVPDATIDDIPEALPMPHSGCVCFHRSTAP
jgi:hypothetical protein